MRVLIASDGSAPAEAALDIAMRFPWPAGSEARGVVASGGMRWASTEVRTARARALATSAEKMRKKLATRWSEAEVVERPQRPADAIRSEAERFGADLIALGWRGYGTFARLLAGSVSRNVAATAKCAVLIARPGEHVPSAVVRRFAMGFDGSANAREAIRFLARLDPPRGNRVALIHVIEPRYVPPLSRTTPLVRALVRDAIARQIAGSRSQAERRLQRAATELRHRGWHVTARIEVGAPLHTFLSEAHRARAEVLVVGARGTTGLAHVLLGSVASGALDQSPLPVLIVKRGDRRR